MPASDRQHLDLGHGPERGHLEHGTGPDQLEHDDQLEPHVDLDRLAALATGIDTATILAAHLGNRPDWMRDGLCREPTYPASWWHPARGTPTRYAVAVCARCIVRAECLDYALTNDLDHGIWGGTTPQERRQLNRARIGPARSPRAS